LLKYSFLECDFIQVQHTFLNTLKNHSLTLARIGLVVLLVVAAPLGSTVPGRGPEKKKHFSPFEGHGVEFDP
jgi:hypothetical protein